ncbi:tail fiber protein [Staphylococcus phage SpP]
MSKWVDIIDSKGTTRITDDFSRLQFLDFQEEDVQTTVNSLEVKGTDGVLVGSSTFAPFKLILRFAYVGTDIKDYHLFKTRIRQTIYKREAYYIVQSDMPARKYAVLPSSISYEDKYGKNGEVTIEFTVFKGYAESLKDTSDITFLTDYWQWENGIVTDNIAYSFDEPRFSVWNGSFDTIDPLMRHDLIIKIKGVSDNGITITNHHTGDVFKYNKSLSQGSTLKIDGVHPYLNSNRAGIDTNHEYIKLLPGWNNIEIAGLKGDIRVNFKFSFIYR